LPDIYSLHVQVKCIFNMAARCCVQCKKVTAAHVWPCLVNIPVKIVGNDEHRCLIIITLLFWLLAAEVEIERA